MISRYRQLIRRTYQHANQRNAGKYWQLSKSNTYYFRYSDAFEEGEHEAVDAMIGAVRPAFNGKRAKLVPNEQQRIPVSALEQGLSKGLCSLSLQAKPKTQTSVP